MPSAQLLEQEPSVNADKDTLVIPSLPAAWSPALQVPVAPTLTVQPMGLWRAVNANLDTLGTRTQTAGSIHAARVLVDRRPSVKTMGELPFANVLLCTSEILMCLAGVIHAAVTCAGPMLTAAGAESEACANACEGT